MPNRLLLADGDPKSLRVLEVSLRNAGFEVTTASTGEAAWEAIAASSPDLIIADADPAGIDGLALCARVRQSAPDRTVPFISLASDKSVEGKIRGLQAGADEYLIKPAYVNEVIARVRALVQRRERDKHATDQAAPEAFSGKLSDITVVDLLDLVGSNRRSGIIHLRGTRGGPATVYFRQGVVVDAEVGRLSGADAIGRLFGWTEGTFEVEWKNIRRPDAIGRPTADLVLDGMKRLDEWRRLATHHPDVNGVFEVNYRVLAERLAEIPDEVNGILRLFDGKRQLAHVVEDSQLNDLDAMTVVARLRDEGIIHEVRAEPDAQDPSGPAPRGRNGDAASARPAVPASPPGGERPSGRTASASGPVEQSFADRLQADASPGSQLSPPPPPPPGGTLPRLSPPPPPPPSTKTDRGFPQLDLGLPATNELGDDELASLGLSLGDAGAAPVVEESAGPNDDNVIPFPVAAVASGPPEEAGDALGADDIAALLAGGMDEPEAEPAPAQAPDGDSGASSHANAAPRQPVSMLLTQRGVGPFPPPAEVDVPLDEEGVPPPTDLPSSVASPDPPDVELDVAPAEGPPPAEFSAPPSPAVAASSEEAAALATAAVAPTADATARFVDREISQGEALDELGVRGRRRVGRVLVAALAAGAVAAVVVYRLRLPQAPAPAATAPDRSEAPASSAPPPPGPTAEAPSPSKSPPSPSPSESAAAAPGRPAAPPPDDKIKPAPAPSVAAAAPTAPTAASSGAPAGSAAPAPSAASSSDHFRRQLAECRGLFGRNRFRDAGVACAAAVEANPRSAEALTMLAHVELNRGHLGRANELAQKAISIYPDQPDAYVIIGGVHQDRGRNAQAKAAYLQYLHLSPHGRYAAELRSIVGSL